MLIYCPDRCKTQNICDRAVDDCLGASKFFPDWFATSKTLEKFNGGSLLANDDILFFDKGFSKVILFANQMGVLGVDLDKINLDDDNIFYEDDPDTIINVRLLAWRNKFEKHKALKKRWMKN